MLNAKKILAMIKAIEHGENPRKSWVLDRWMTVPDTAKERSILGCVERRLALKSNPTDEDIMKAIDAYVSV
jgi:hypothetical protein